MKVEVAILGSRVDVKQHSTKQSSGLCERRRGRPGLPVPNSPYYDDGLCGRKASLN